MFRLSVQYPFISVFSNCQAYCFCSWVIFCHLPAESEQWKVILLVLCATLNIHIKWWECFYFLWDISILGIFSLVKQRGGWFKTSQVRYPKTPPLKEWLSEIFSLQLPPWQQVSKALFFFSPPKNEQDFHQISALKINSRCLSAGICVIRCWQL